MKARSLVVACAAVGAMFVAGSGSASANLAWCVSDPPVHVVTPGGSNLTINNMVYLPAGAQHLQNQISDGATVASDGNGGTLVTVHVYVPAAAHVISSEHRFGLSTEGDGTSVITLYLDVPIT
jgi:hypothetical protein